MKGNYIMKKTLSLILAGLIAMSFAACGGDNEESKAESKPANESVVSTPADDSSAVEESSVAEESSKEDESNKVTDPLKLLEDIWGAYEEDEKFAISGGDSNSPVMDKPGSFSLEDGDVFDNVLGYPKANLDSIDSAASMQFIMNANSFTVGAYHLKDGADTAALTKAIRDSIQGRQWMCGFPDKLIVVVIDECIISGFGKEDMINPFLNHITELYSSANVAYDEPIE